MAYFTIITQATSDRMQSQANVAPSKPATRKTLVSTGACTVCACATTLGILRKASCWFLKEANPLTGDWFIMRSWSQIKSKVLVRKCAKGIKLHGEHYVSINKNMYFHKNASSSLMVCFFLQSIRIIRPNTRTLTSISRPNSTPFSNGSINSLQMSYNKMKKRNWNINLVSCNVILRKIESIRNKKKLKWINGVYLTGLR